jgi:hypothetical protein
MREQKLITTEGDGTMESIRAANVREQRGLEGVTGESRPPSGTQDAGQPADMTLLSPEAEDLASHDASEPEGAGETTGPRDSSDISDATQKSGEPEVLGSRQNVFARLAMAFDGSAGINGMPLPQGTWPAGGQTSGGDEFENLIDSFSQGSKGNCASVATIKAAMDTYGDDVFQSVSQTPNGGYQVTMQDGVQVSISPAEMKIAERMADFEGMEGEEKDYALLCYAAMAERAQMEKNDGKQTYIGACRSLNNGEWPEDSAHFLGLEDKVVEIDPNQITDGEYDSVVGWSNDHAIYIDNENGNYVADHYGEDYAYDGTDTDNNDLVGAYTFI